MGSITRSFANNFTTSGVLLPESLNNNSISNVTSYNASLVTGNMVLISSQTASNSASISFTTGIDSTYKEYQFYFIDIHARTNSVQFGFQTSTNSGSSYGVTATTTLFRAIHAENDSETALSYMSNDDYAQSSSYLTLNNFLSNESDMCCTGTMQLFNPSSTTYVKHFIARTSSNHGTGSSVYQFDYNTAGYFNTTSAVNALQFKMDSGNFDGTILMYGIK